MFRKQLSNLKIFFLSTRQEKLINSQKPLAGNKKNRFELPAKKRENIKKTSKNSKVQ